MHLLFSTGVFCSLWLLAWQAIPACDAFSTTGSSTSPLSTSMASPPPSHQPYGNALILDHLNINHEKGRHDWLKAFYFDFLQMVVDPRKAENMETGRKTLWANIGTTQFHLPEGQPDAQVLNGCITLAYPRLQDIVDRYDRGVARQQLAGSQFAMKKQTTSDEEDDNDTLHITDPWGTQFLIVQGSETTDRDDRGQQPGGKSEGFGIVDLMVYVPQSFRSEQLAGIGRFYEHVMGAPVQHDKEKCVVTMGPWQSLTFCRDPDNKNAATESSHVDLVQEQQQQQPADFLSNYGPHISLYVADLAATYRRAEALGVTYVNPRFKRRAYTAEQALDQCMFRCLDIVDPMNRKQGPILQLEHEVRSVTQPDGTLYKSCPFDEIPPECTSERRLNE